MLTPPAAPQADIWSCGIIIYILLGMEAPFGDGADNATTERAVLHSEPCVLGGQWDYISMEAKDCVLRMLVGGACWRGVLLRWCAVLPCRPMLRMLVSGAH
jgi:hypothetical protein